MGGQRGLPEETDGQVNRRDKQAVGRAIRGARWTEKRQREVGVAKTKGTGQRGQRQIN